MGGSWGDCGKKCIRISHYRMKRDHCKINELEVLNQAIGFIKFLKSKYRDVKSRRGKAK